MALPLEDTLVRGYRLLAAETPRRRIDVELRVLDLLFAGLFGVLLAPVAALIALLVLTTSGRPVLYRGGRVARGGRIFTMLKFRTLRADAESRLGPYLGEELVAWRSRDKVAAVWNSRCPHRGMRLALGAVAGNALTCAYHGWVFESSGACSHIPAHPRITPSAGARTRVVSELQLDLVDEAREVAPGADLGRGEARHDLLIGHRQHQVALAAVL